MKDLTKANDSQPLNNEENKNKIYPQLKIKILV